MFRSHAFAAVFVATFGVVQPLAARHQVSGQADVQTGAAPATCIAAPQRCPISRRSDTLIPGQVQGHFSVTSGCLDYEVSGRKGAPVIVALHGFGGALDTWDHIRKLLDSDYRFYVPDLMGFGLSARPKGYRYTIGEQAQAVSEFLEFVQRDSGSRGISLIGHSYGGSVAIAALARLQQKNQPMVERLILIDALGFPERVHFPLYIRILRVPGLNRIVLGLVPAKTQVRIVLKNIFRKGSDKVGPDLVRDYAQFFCLPGSHTALIRTAKQLGNRSEISDFTRQVSSIDVPTRIIWGEGDRLLPPDQGRRLKEAIPHSELKFLPSGHVPPEELPEETARLIREFLSVGTPR